MFAFVISGQSKRHLHSIDTAVNCSMLLSTYFFTQDSPFTSFVANSVNQDQTAPVGAV